MSALLSALGGLMAILLVIWGPKDIFKSKSDLQIQRLMMQISSIESRVTSMTTVSTNVLSPDVAALTKQIEAIQADIGGLKGLLLSDPEATLTLPLIKKDIEQIKKDSADLRTDVMTMAGLGKWFIGSLITIALGLFSLVVTVLLKK